MLSSTKLKKWRTAFGKSVNDLAVSMVPQGIPAEKAAAKTKELRSAIKNWENGLMKPAPKTKDIESLARALGVDQGDLQEWSATHMYAPMAPRKVRLVTNLIKGYPVQHALDMLKFTNKRAAVYVEKVLSSAIANADEHEADVDKLIVTEARVDEGGIRQGTRRWRPKDRGRAVSFTRLASHIHVTVDEE